MTFWTCNDSCAAISYSTMALHWNNIEFELRLKTRSWNNSQLRSLQQMNNSILVQKGNILYPVVTSLKHLQLKQHQRCASSRKYKDRNFTWTTDDFSMSLRRAISQTLWKSVRPIQSFSSSNFTIHWEVTVYPCPITPHMWAIFWNVPSTKSALESRRDETKIQQNNEYIVDGSFRALTNF